MPTAVICTQPFASSGKVMSRLQGAPDYPFAVIPHPIGSLTPDELSKRAKMALPQVVQLLLRQDSRKP